MSLDGTWQLTLSNPMGDNYATAEMVSDSGTITGKYTGLGTTEDIAEGSVEGDRVQWTVYRKQPIEWALRFDLRMQGADAMVGEVEVGNFGSYKVTGERR